jgi:hypothetical protein
MAFPFLFLRVLWIVNGVIVLLGAKTSYERAIAISIVTLFYALPMDRNQYHHDSFVFERKAARETS